MASNAFSDALRRASINVLSQALFLELKCAEPLLCWPRLQITVPNSYVRLWSEFGVSLV